MTELWLYEHFLLCLWNLCRLRVVFSCLWQHEIMSKRLVVKYLWWLVSLFSDVNCIIVYLEEYKNVQTRRRLFCLRKKQVCSASILAWSLDQLMSQGKYGWGLLQRLRHARLIGLTAERGNWSFEKTSPVTSVVFSRNIPFKWRRHSWGCLVLRLHLEGVYLFLTWPPHACQNQCNWFPDVTLHDHKEWKCHWDYLATDQHVQSIFGPQKKWGCFLRWRKSGLSHGGCHLTRVHQFGMLHVSVLICQQTVLDPHKRGSTLNLYLCASKKTKGAPESILPFVDFIQLQFSNIFVQSTFVLCT